MISGANRGIGAAVAAELAQAGWALSLGARKPETIPPLQGPAAPLKQPFDAQIPDSEKRWVEATLDYFGRIDAVINNAGAMIPKNIIEASAADLDLLLEVNVKSPFRLVQAAWPHLIRCGQGRVVTIVSLSGKRVKSANSGIYAISKSAELALSHAVRRTGFDQGIRATAICPSFVATDMARALVDMDPDKMTQPEDIARIVRTVLELPNTASVAEIPVNWTDEDFF